MPKNPRKKVKRVAEPFFNVWWLFLPLIMAIVAYGIFNSPQWLGETVHKPKQEASTQVPVPPNAPQLETPTTQNLDSSLWAANTVSWSALLTPRTMTMSCGKGGNVSISLESGHVTITGCSLDDGAKAFWKAVEWVVLMGKEAPSQTICLTLRPDAPDTDFAELPGLERHGAGYTLPRKEWYAGLGKFLEEKECEK